MSEQMHASIAVTYRPDGTGWTAIDLQIATGAIQVTDEVVDQLEFDWLVRWARQADIDGFVALPDDDLVFFHALINELSRKGLIHLTVRNGRIGFFLASVPTGGLPQ